MKKKKQIQHNKKKKIQDNKEDKKIEDISIVIEERNYTRRIYCLLCFIFSITGIFALIIRTDNNILSFLRVYQPLVALFGMIQFIIAYFFMKNIKNISTKIAIVLFIIYPPINGIILSLVYPAFTVLHLKNQSYCPIAYNFLVAGGLFGIMIIYGFFTQIRFNMKNLILMLATGLIITYITNILLNIIIIYRVTNYIFIFISTIVIAKYSLIKSLDTELPNVPDKNMNINLVLYLYLETIMAFSLVIAIIMDIFKHKGW